MIFFQIRSVLKTRSYPFKLFKSRCSSNIRSTFVAERVINIWNSLPSTVIFSQPSMIYRQCFIQTPKHWGENYDCWGGRRSSAEGARSSRRRRRDRDAEGVEGVGNGEGVSPSPAD